MKPGDLVVWSALAAVEIAEHPKAGEIAGIFIKEIPPYGRDPNQRLLQITHKGRMSIVHIKNVEVISEAR